MEFPNVRFTPPVGTAQATAPAVVPMSRPAKKTRPWRRWAAAAAILLALGGIAAPGYWMERDYTHASRIVSEKQVAASAAREQMQDAARQMQDLPREEQTKVDEARDALRASQLQLAVVGQETVAAGAPATYEIQTSDLNNRPVAAAVEVRVVGQNGAPVGGAIPVVKAADGKSTVTLPADLPVKPDSKLTLVVSAGATPASGPR